MTAPAWHVCVVVTFMFLAVGAFICVMVVVAVVCVCVCLCVCVCVLVLAEAERVGQKCDRSAGLAFGRLKICFFLPGYKSTHTCEP